MDSLKNPQVLVSKMTIPTTVGVSREVIDPSDDSGLSSMSEISDLTNTKLKLEPSTEESVVIKKETSENTSSAKDSSTSSVTILNGIAFVDPERIVTEQRLIAEERENNKKKVKEEVVLERRLAQEKYEKEIQDKQYKRLMHLLSQSKALSNFMLKKVEDTKKDVGKQSKNPGKKPGKRVAEPSNKAPPKKRIRKPNQKYIEEVVSKVQKDRKKMNLSSEAISEELNDMSDEEVDEKENSQTVVNFVQPKYFVGELRDYQKVGLNWLKVLYENGLNGILADEMGLGKTIQVIALFAYLIEKQIPGPYLVIVPLSTLPNWESEFERFAPKLPVVTYYGSADARLALRSKLCKKYKLTPGYSTEPIVLMTYQAPMFDNAFLKNFKWRYIVIDEAQRIKNYQSLLFRIVKGFPSLNRLLLTGTPLQNNLTELWSLLNFLLPDVFNNLDVFQSWFDAKNMQGEEGKKKILQQEQEKQVLSSLREILKPFLLRRLKEEVCPDIPPMKEVIVYTPMTAIQYELYSAILNRDIYKLQRQEQPSDIVDVDGVRPKRKCTQKIDLDYYWRSNTGVNSIFSNENATIGNTSVKQKDVAEWTDFADVTEDNAHYYVRLKMQRPMTMYQHVVNHPYLIHYPLNDCGLGLVDDSIVKSAGKVLVLDAMLKKLKERGHEVLFFSNFKMVLEIIEDYLYYKTDYEYVRLDGDVKFEDRRCNIEKFQTDPNVFMFLLTTKAGAVGLNLAAADTVILYDSDWNPQNDLQAMARCHRIGQTRPVAVYRLCTKGTVDEEIIKRANAKRFLEKAVISKEKDFITNEGGLLKLKKLLEENTFKVTDPKQAVYSEAELDELLDRSDMVQPVKTEASSD